MECKKCESNFRTINTPDNKDRVCYKCGHNNGKKKDEGLTKQMKETSLSEKIHAGDDDIALPDHIYSKDVREAVKRLKKRLCRGKKHDTIVKDYCSKGNNYYCEECEGIDEEFGDKLI